MGKDQKKPKEPPTWERRPWPKDGDVDQDALYASIGRAISEWERYDAVLAFLFSSFVATESHKAARRSYSAVRTFEGRMDMLRASSEAYFEERPNKEFQDQFKLILTNATRFSERRNEIAHGCVEHFRPKPPEPGEFPAPMKFALFPSFATFKHRDVNEDPTYCYTSLELDYFRIEFFKLKKPASDLSISVIKDAARKSSLGKLRMQYLLPTSPEVEEKS